MSLNNYKVHLQSCIRIATRALFMLIVLISAGQTARGSHIAGADLTYEYIGNGQYRVVYTFYRDCFGIDAPTTASMTMSSPSCGNFSQSFTLNQVPGTGQEISYACPGTVTTCNGGTAPGFQQWQYEAIVTLPSQCPDWTFTVADCCRNEAITTVTDPDNYSLHIEAKLNNTVFDNSSPTFTNAPVTFLCIGQDNFYNHGVIDAEGDSLAYFFIPPRDGENTNLPYQPGYSISNPISSSPAVSIDPVTGDIFTHPTASEVGVIAVLILEYRNGILIGSVMRDLQVYTVQCNNTLPSATGVNGGNNFNASTCPGSQLCFDINAADTDPGDVLSMTWNNAIPGATFTVSGSPVPVGTFCWTPDPSDARPQPYTFTVTVRDDACPSNGVQTYSYSIMVGGLNSASLNITDATCNGNDGAIQVIVDNSTGPYTYVWNPNVSTGSSATGLSPGMYSVAVSDANGCTANLTGTVNSSGIIASVVSQTDATCSNGDDGSATVSGSGGTAPYSYLWMPNGDTTATVNNLAPGVYNVAVSDYFGCTGFVDVTIGSENQAPVVNLGPDVTGCIGATVTLDAGPGFASYLWNDNSSAQTLGVTANGTYSVLVTDNNGCENFDAVVVNFIQCQTVRPVITPVGGPGTSLFPNPGRNRVQLSIPDVSDTDVTVIVRDILGNVLTFSEEAASKGYTKIFDISNYAAGIYTVNVSYAGQITTLRLVKE